jgi:hypothetical protein
MVHIPWSLVNAYGSLHGREWPNMGRLYTSLVEKKEWG